VRRRVRVITWTALSTALVVGYLLRVDPDCMFDPTVVVLMALGAGALGVRVVGGGIWLVRRMVRRRA
jgi:hypothetical protein